MIEFNGFAFSLFDINVTIDFKTKTQSDKSPRNSNTYKEDKTQKEQIEPLNLNPICFADFEKVLSQCEHPNVYLMVELEPSTSWNLVTPVIETTEGLYVFSKDCALQGSGGGLFRTQEAIRIINKRRKQNHSIKLTAKVCPNYLLEKLRGDISAWPELKANSIMNKTNDQFKWINKQYLELVEY